MKTGLIPLLLLIFFFGMTAQAENNPNGKISGLAFGDYYYMFANHNPDLKQRNGLWFRRIYFTYDQAFSEKWSMRLRLEMAHPGDFSTKKSAVPFVKDAYLKYKINRLQLLLGISPTPTFAVIEKIWGYRPVEKTPADLFKMGSSRETGLALKGTIGSDKTLFYHLMFGNGNGQKGETDQYKKLMVAMGWNITKHLLFEGYLDFEQRPEKEQRFSYQGFLAYHSKMLSAGLQYLIQKRNFSKENDLKIGLLSAFVRSQFKKQLAAFLRIDKVFDKIPDGPKIAYLPFSDQSAVTLVIAGVDFSLKPNIHLIPNVEVSVYDQSQIDNDFMGRLTFFYTFK